MALFLVHTGVESLATSSHATSWRGRLRDRLASTRRRARRQLDILVPIVDDLYVRERVRIVSGTRLCVL